MQATNLVRLTFQEKMIRVRESDAGYLWNLTDLWKAAGCGEDDRPRDWLRTADARRLLEAVKAKLNRVSDPILRTRGRFGGTWAHWQLAMGYAKYLSGELHYLINDWARRYAAIAPTLSSEIIKADDAPTEIVVANDERIGEVKGIVQETHGDVKQLLRTTSENSDGLDEIRAYVRLQVAHSRKRLSRRTKEAHVQAARYYCAGLCPHCMQRPIFDEDGKFTGVFDHAVAASRANVRNTWPTCAPCNQSFEVDGDRGPNFKAYQNFLRRFGSGQTGFGFD
jgi:hypothetical protein